MWRGNKFTFTLFHPCYRKQNQDKVLTMNKGGANHDISRLRCVLFYVFPENRTWHLNLIIF